MSEEKVQVKQEEEPSGASSESPRPAPGRVEFSAKYYREAGAFVKDDRTITSMIRVEPCPIGGALIVATDGVTMAIFRDAKGECSEPITVPYKAVERVGDLDRIRLSPNVIWLVRNTRIVGGAVYADGEYTFPNWRAILPKVGGEVLAFFDPKLLSKCSLGAESMSIVAPDEKNPALVRPAGRDDVFAVISPMRANSTDYGALATFKTWFDVPEATVAAAAGD